MLVTVLSLLVASVVAQDHAAAPKAKVFGAGLSKTGSTSLGFVQTCSFCFPRSHDEWCTHGERDTVHVEIHYPLSSPSTALDMLGYSNLHNDRAFFPFLFPEGEYNFAGLTQWIR